MVEPRYRSKSLRKVFRKTPGGRVVTHFEKRKPSKTKCGICGAVLKGVPNERPYKMENMPKSRKRPERAYGGVLCSRCSARAIISKARKKAVEDSGSDEKVEK